MFERKVEYLISGGMKDEAEANAPLILTRYLATTIGAATSELLIRRSFIVAEQPDLEVSKSFLGNVFSLLKQTFREWLQDKAPQLGAALAFTQFFRSRR